MRIEVKFEDRVGIAQEILSSLSRRSYNVTASEVDPPYVYLDVPQLTDQGYQLSMSELLNIPGVIRVKQVAFLPGAQRSLYLDAIMASQADPLLAVDAQGAVVIANKAAIVASGLDARDLIGSQLHDLIGLEDVMKLLLEHHFHLPIMEIELNKERYMLESTPMHEGNGTIAGALVTLHAYSRIGERMSALQHYSTGGFETIIGNSVQMTQLKERAARMALVDAPLMITGETGTGKELLAHACHAVSNRKSQPFFALNCAALPENLAESELFGYAGGSFTGALRGGKPGLLELADGGTVFLDEVGEMSPYLQAKLLRFLNDGCFRRVGGDRELKVDVRIISATHRSLEEMVPQGKFRQDLMYRLNVLNLHVPPLRERMEDMEALTDSILHSACRQVRRAPMRLTSGAKKALTNNHWIGNVRQLRNVIFRAVTLANASVIDVADLELAQTDSNTGLVDASQIESLEGAMNGYERHLLEKFLKDYPSTRRLANRLKLSHSAIAVRLRKHQLKLDT